jgi:drug/metabolite transporter (DMT)-like permease
MTRPSFPLGAALVAGGALCWSFAGVVTRSLQANPWEIVFWRSVVMSLVLGGSMLVFDRAATLDALRRAWRAMLLSAFCLSGAFVGFFVALQHTTVANTLVVTASAPLIAALLARVFLGEAVRPATWIAMLAAIGGVSLTVVDSLSVTGFVGPLLALFCAISFAANMVVIRTRPDVNMMFSVVLGGIVSALITLPLAWPFPAPANEIPWLAFLGIVQLGLGLVLFTLGLRHLPAATASLVGLLETVLGPLWVWLAFGETPGLYGFIGGGVILGALALNTLWEARAARPRPAPA